MRPLHLAAVLCGIVSATSVVLSPSPTSGQEKPAQNTQASVAPLADGSIGTTRNVHVCGKVTLAGQPSIADIELMSKAGVKRVISFRTPGEVNWDEAAEIKAAGMDFIAIPFRTDSLTDEVFSRVRGLLRESDAQPTMLHCGSANRVGAVWFTYRVIDQGVAIETAIKEAKEVGLRDPKLEEIARDYVSRKLKESASSKSVKPGINAKFLDPDMNVDEWVKRFEIESREVFLSRQQVLKACDIEPGFVVADIGSGTGLYTRLFSQAVGNDGTVYAVDISPKFIRHLEAELKQADRNNVKTLLCTSRSTLLPPGSVDLAFACDTYHHFEYPQETLTSILRSLRPGGRFVLIDFDRIPGTSREWLLGHIRATDEQVS